MSYNDRLREAAAWVAAHRGETITLTIPKAELADALNDAADCCNWPPMLSGWARELARRSAGICQACYDASLPVERWDMYGEPTSQPTHDDCAGGNCTCPHRTEDA